MSKIPITFLQVEPHYTVDRDLGKISAVGSIIQVKFANESGITESHPISINMDSGAPMLNHYGKRKLFTKCYARLRKHAQKLGANAIVALHYSFSITESGSGNDSYSSPATDPIYACTMVVVGGGGEAVIEH